MVTIRKIVLNKNGLTLLELLLATTLMVVVGLGVYRVFSSSIAMYDWLSRNKPQNDAIIFFEKISYDLRNFCDITDKSFQGSAEEINFYVHNTDYDLLGAKEMELAGNAMNPPLYKVEYIFDKQKREIKRKLYKYGEAEPFKNSVVLSDVRKAEFSFFIQDYADSDLKGFYSKAYKLPMSLGVNLQISGEGSQKVFYKIIEIPLNIA